ncbi:unnamed protein product [Brassicogethes aeneus]|uniref:UDP-glucuronosyltransferase n=1 Tax=Brassicogethes aeneus TaxID=1431903 RepID=A0A9P0ASY5_BRAAE|nr:unnamed protein product [Brassicogethes aeneus]
MSSVIFTILCSLCFCEGAKILAVVSTPSYSHQVYFHNLWRELLARGHHVTLISTEPIYDNDLINLTNININATYDAVDKMKLMGKEFSMWQLINQFEDFLRTSTKLHFSHPEVKKLLNDSSAHFDLVIYELVASSLVYSWKFSCPSILVSSLDSSLEDHFILGNSFHPLVTPEQNVHIADPEKISFLEKLVSITYSVSCISFMYTKFYPAAEEEIKKQLGYDVPSLWELSRNISLIMDATNPIFHNIRAVGPNTIHIGSGLHINKPKSLPEDLKDFLDNSPVPVVYFSLGTNVKGNLLNQTTKAEFYKAFSELPYKFLVKVDWENLTIPKNVKVARWLPQQDVLRHANVKLFITQGGLQSLQEAVTNAIPMVGIPFFGDQFQNVQKIVKRGIAVKLHRHEISKETIKNAITKVLTDPTYKQKVEEMRDLMYDEPMTSLDKAIWWIEYVLRHKGAPLFKSNAANMPMYEYLMLDVIGAVLAFLIVLSVFIKLIYKSLKFILSRLIGGYFVKSKKKRD